VSASVAATAPALRLRGIGKSFGPIPALRWAADASLEVAAGEIHGLVGENGAGKSTLLSVLAGVTRPDGGRLELDGVEWRPASVADARRHGVEIVLQDSGLVGSLSVRENFVLGRSAAQLRARRTRRARTAALVREALALVAPEVAPGDRADGLTLEQRKLVELARATCFRPRLLLVDEITACLGHDAAARMFELLRRERARGVAIVYISHYLEEVRQLCDRVTVLRDGELVTSLDAARADDETLMSLMVGRQLAPTLRGLRDGGTATDRPLLEVRDLSLDEKITDVGFELRPGEILGIGGLVGCGSQELACVVAGALRAGSGSMHLDGRPYRPTGIRSAMRRGVSYVPPDRDREGLLLRQSISANVVLNALPDLAYRGLYTGLREHRRVEHLTAQLRVKCRSVRQTPLELSGGNRQKVLLAKALLTGPRLVVLHNPTRGVDVAAKADIYALLARLAADGVAILLVSDELPELITMSDRILLMRRGRITHETHRGDSPSEEDLITHMV